MIDPRRYARVMGYSHGQATGHSRRAAHRQATGGQATAMQGRFRQAAIRPAVRFGTNSRLFGGLAQSPDFLEFGSRSVYCQLFCTASGM